MTLPPSRSQPETERLEDAHRSLPGLELVVVVDGGTAVHTLTDGAESLLGRSEEVEVVIDHPSVSRRHARLRVKGLRIELIDLDSANGIMLDGERLPPRTWGDLSIGRVAELGEAMVLCRPARRRKSPSPPSDDSPIVGTSMTPVMETLRHVAPAPVPVLLHGETGVGKQVAAESLHRMSGRRGAFVELNAAALPATLLESELFGHERGAFTGADRARKGLIEQADGGTLFLDEVGELPLEMQAKLLRTLEDPVITPLGGRQPARVDVRFVAATNRDLEAEVAAGRFRADLLFRLDAVRVELPPLRERLDEIEPLVARFTRELSDQMGFAQPPSYTAAALAALRAHDWPGNVRELRNIVQRTVLLARKRTIDVDDLPSLGGEPPARSTTDGGDLQEELEELERRRVVEALDACAGNQTRAAKQLGMSRRALIRRIEAYGIPRPRKK